MFRLINQLSPNPRLQRTCSALLRSPLSRKSFGVGRGFVGVGVLLCLACLACGRPTLDREKAAELLKRAPIFAQRLPPGPNEPPWRLHLSKVTGITTSGDGTVAQVEYETYCEGECRAEEAGVRKTGRAEFRLYDDGWRLVHL